MNKEEEEEKVEEENKQQEEDKIRIYNAVFCSNTVELYSWAKAIVSTEQGEG